MEANVFREFIDGRAAQNAAAVGQVIAFKVKTMRVITLLAWVCSRLPLSELSFKRAVANKVSVRTCSDPCPDADNGHAFAPHRRQPPRKLSPKLSRWFSCLSSRSGAGVDKLINIRNLPSEASCEPSVIKLAAKTFLVALPMDKIGEPATGAKFSALPGGFRTVGA